MPQLGAFIGGLIGGAIDPTEIEGPHIGDGHSQSSAEGVPIAWVIGTAGWIQGNIVQKSPRREVKKEDDGKGGPVTVTYEAHQDFCIMPCESSETRNSLMVGPLIVRVNGKIVYDMRPEQNFAAENAKFLQNHRFYIGSEDQLPDPTMEAITGIGNTPAYRGVFTMVAVDINLSPYGDAIPTYEFVMVGAGSSDTIVTEHITGPTYGRFADNHYPLVDSEGHYTFVGARSIVDGGDRIEFEADTITEIISHFNALGYNGTVSDLFFYQGYSATNLRFSTDFTIDSAEAQPTVVDGVAVILCYSQAVADSWYNANPSTGCVVLPYISPGLPEWYGFSGGELGRIHAQPEDPNYTNYNYCTGLPWEPDGYPYVQGIAPLYILVTAKKAPLESTVGDPCALGRPVLLPDSPGFVIDCAGVVSPEVTYVEESGSFYALQAEDVDVIGGDQSVFAKYTVGPIIEVGDPIGTEAFWTEAYDAAVIEGTMPAGLVYPDDYPESLGDAYRGTTSVTEITSNSVSLATALTRICERGGLTTSDIDVADMDEPLMGYVIAQPYNGADCIRPLMSAFLSYGTEYDAKIHFHKHGEDIQIVVDPDDFIEGSEDTDKSTREQAIEYPRLISVTAIDPTQDYTARPQSERRISPDVRAIGEQSIQVPVVMPPDQQRQLAAVAMKVAWARAQGSREFSVPYAQSDVYLKMVSGKPFALDSKRYMAGKIRTEDGELRFEGLYDRQSAYTSDVTATPALPPTPPPTSLGGITIFQAMNLPSLRSQDNVPGVYIAACGILPNWPGCLLQMSIDDGASWTTAIGSVTQASVIGSLTSDIEENSAGEVVSVVVNGGELNSVTLEDLDNGANASALITNDISEIIQFEDATETSEDNYELSGLIRARLNTVEAAHFVGDRFVKLDSVYFLPLDQSLAGRTILFRPVTFGTTPDLSAIYSLVFDPPTFVIDGGGA